MRTGGPGLRQHLVWILVPTVVGTVCAFAATMVGKQHTAYPVLHYTAAGSLLLGACLAGWATVRAWRYDFAGMREADDGAGD